MHNAEAAIEPAFYDHEDDSVQRDRAAADWGADEVFASVPRRRFRGDHHGTPGARRNPARRVSGPALEEDADDAAARAAWLAGVEAEIEATEAPPRATEPVPAPAEPLRAGDLTEGVVFDAPGTWAEADPEPAGRRIVTITGHPGLPAAPARPLPAERRRPPRTVDERIGGRPDRLAGWAFGMGILLIVVAAFS